MKCHKKDACFSNTNLRLLFIAFTILLCFCSGAQSLRLPALVADSMILQRDLPIKIWGWSNNGNTVTIDFRGKKYTAQTGPDHKWMLSLPPMKAGGPYSMKISAKDTLVTIKGILLGDVWLCSGQSNMEFGMATVSPRFPGEIAGSANTYIREFHVDKAYDFTPKTEVTGSWRPASPANTGGFTAVGYFMAKALQAKYKIPIGIIHTSWGGTPIESWMSEESLQNYPASLEKAAYFRNPVNRDSVLKRDDNFSVEWFKKLEAGDKGITEKWFDTAYRCSSCKTLQVPGFWERQNLRVDGAVWLRKEIDLTEEMIQSDATLELGTINHIDYTYFNGQQVGTSEHLYAVRKYTIPARLLKKGKNLIVVRVINKEGWGGFAEGKQYRFTAGSENISLEGPWSYEVGNSMETFPSAKFVRLFKQPVALYNAMIAPLIPYGIKGVAWYQGESNVAQAKEYRDLLPTMIKDWRARWQQGNFPFLIVQLANYMAPAVQPVESAWAELREAQLITAQTTPRCALAVTIDVGEADDIHPLDKKTVGDRLAWAAADLAYGGPNTASGGPLYQYITAKGDSVVLSFTGVGSGLIAKNGVLKGFAIAGADKKFVWANAVIVNDKVMVWNNSISSPAMVRYAWANNPEGCNLYNKEGLPAVPFQAAIQKAAP